MSHALASSPAAPYVRAIAFVDHQRAEILPFDTLHHDRIRVLEHGPTTQGTDPRALHAFFSDVCDALSAYDAFVVVGPKTGVSDFRRYLGKYRPYLIDQAAGYETADPLTLPQLLDRGRAFFGHPERLTP
ncbi:MAG: hypothetical protein QM667_05325 [Asticcacaulis sp.]